MISNLRIPDHMSASDYQALIATVMGCPAFERDEPSDHHQDVQREGPKLTEGQRKLWSQLVAAGWPINTALMRVRGLL